jgi:hypothetical protein
MEPFRTQQMAMDGPGYSSGHLSRYQQRRYNMNMQHTAPQSTLQPSSCWVTVRRLPTRVRAYECNHGAGKSIRDRPSGVRESVAEKRDAQSQVQLAGS